MFKPGIKIKEEKGFLLLSALLVIIFLSILSAVIFNQSISENSLVKIDLDELKAKHNADFGLACVSYELINFGTSWVTHIANTASPYVLNKSLIAPNPTVPGTSIEDYMTGEIQDRKYTMPGVFEAKVFKDPMQPSYVDDIIVLSRGKSGSQTYLLAAKISAQSLYQYFIFTPFTTEKNAVELYANGGKIHINGDFGFWNNVHIKDVSELSLSGYIYSKNYSEVPPSNDCNLGNNNCFWETYFYSRRDPWQAKNSLNTGTPLDYYHNVDGWVQGDLQGLYMSNPRYCTQPGPGCTSPYNPNDPSTYFYVPCNNQNSCTSPDPDGRFNWYNRNLYTYKNYLKQGVSSGGTYTDVSIKPCNPVSQKCNPDITSGPDTYDNSNSPIDIPHRLNAPDGTPYEYDWDRYWESSCPAGQTTNCGIYWDMNGDGTKEHIWSTPSTRKTNFTNTLYQGQGWQQFLALEYNSSLNNVVKEHNTGGAAISPIRINEQTYFSKAETNGMYIYKDIYEELQITINGVLVTKEGNQFKVGTTVIAEKISFVDVNSTNQKDVVKLDIAAMKSVPNNAAIPKNGIIYANYNIALTEAQKLFDPGQTPNGGLTTVTSENCYLAGDYNYKPSTSDPNVPAADYQWRPSAVIASKYVYTLSQNFFNNPPQAVQYTIHNPNYPYNASSNPPNTQYDEATWNADHSATMAPLVDKDYRYYVSLVGYMAHPPNELERWSDDKKRIIVGAFVNLAYDNFKAQGVVDSDKQRCYNADGNCSYPGGCRDCSNFPGWAWDMTSLVPGAGRNIFKFESRYDIIDASTLPPGALTGYSPKLLLNLVDDDYNFSHHCIQLN